MCSYPCCSGARNIAYRLLFMSLRRVQSRLLPPIFPSLYLRPKCRLWSNRSGGGLSNTVDLKIKKQINGTAEAVYPVGVRHNSPGATSAKRECNPGYLPSPRPNPVRVAHKIVGCKLMCNPYRVRFGGRCPTPGVLALRAR